MSQTTVVVCSWGQKGEMLSDEVRESLTLARGLCESLGTSLRLLLLGGLETAAVEDAGAYGAANIDLIEDEKLEEFSPDIYLDALAQYFAARPPQLLLFPQTFEARSLVPCLAGRLGASIVMNTVALEACGDGFLATACGYGGDTRVVYECTAGAPYLFAINPNALDAQPAAQAHGVSVDTVAVDLSSSVERVRVLKRAEAAEGPRLEHAQTIVAGGRGLGVAANFRLVEELAEALGGMAGASRPIVDDGWATPAQQVGLTGKITKPALYVAAGISGASQHMVGCTAAKTLVAVNRDPDAAVFRYADFGIVGDCLELLPELTKAVAGQG